MSVAGVNYRLFQERLQEYLVYNKRELGPLLESRANRIRFAIFKEYRAIAPSGATIEAQAMASIKAGRGLRRPHGLRLSAREEIRRRKKARMYLASSFIARGWKVSKVGQSGTFKATNRQDAPTGFFTVRTTKGTRNPRVRIQSNLGGAAIQNSQRRLVDRAYEGERRDMEAYILKKQRQQFQRKIGRMLIHV